MIKMEMKLKSGKLYQPLFFHRLLHNLMNFLYASNRMVLREWFSKNFEMEKEIWLVFSNKFSSKNVLSYNDAVEEALCFGWIDGIAKKLDDFHHMRRFSPRRKNSPYSRLNIERLIYLESKKLIHNKIRNSVINLINEPYVFPIDIINEIKKDNEVWNNYIYFKESYKRIRIAHIDSARNQPAEFKKRLETFINKTRLNKLIIYYGGAEKYYK